MEEAIDNLLEMIEIIDLSIRKINRELCEIRGHKSVGEPLSPPSSNDKYAYYKCGRCKGTVIQKV